MRLLLAGLALASSLSARKFYDDDPLRREPPLLPVGKVAYRAISDIHDLFWHTFATPGEKKPIPPGDVNTLGEVMEGAWYEKRHAARRMTPAELMAGPGADHPPAEGLWSVLSAKSEGITPGFVIEDAQKQRFFIKFDPVLYPEIATSADVIGSKFFYALGYHTPENYIVSFTRDRLRLRRGAMFRDERGRRREMTDQDLGETLMKAARRSGGEFRACASRVLPGESVGPFRYFGTRADDPNDTVPHEHRRSLRGFQVFAAWLGHDDSRSINTLDTVVSEGGGRFIRHHLIDFGSLFGSASNGPTSPRSGFEPLFSWTSAAKEFFSLGLVIPGWARAHYPDIRSVGRFGADRFDPVTWTPEYPNPAFENRTAEDVFWAAAQVVAFTDSDIRAVVSTGRYSDPAAVEHMVKSLVARRDAIGRAYLSQPLSIADIRIEAGKVTFEDLGVRLGYISEPPSYDWRWFVFDNNEDEARALNGARTAEIPAHPAPYLQLHITGGNQTRRVAVYLKRGPAGHKIVGIERVL